VDPPARACPDVVSWLRVCLVPGVPPRTLRKLLVACGTPQSLLAEDPARVAAIAGPGIAVAFARGCEASLLEATLRWLEAPGHDVVALGDARYPPRLLQIEDPPPLLYVAGHAERLAQEAFAIVGSRNATAQGREDAEAFAEALSRAGLAIVSGLAMGIDAAAHRGGLRGPGSSVAVMGTGPEACYPADHGRLAAALERDGCLVSEFPVGTPPRPGNFPRRNRLITGMSLGVLVVEAGLPSGSLTTARHALEQGRDVFAMPGSIHSPLSKGCHWLIKEGAKLAECALDVLEELRWERGAQAVEAAAPDDRDGLLNAMGRDPVSLDQLAKRSGLGAASVAARISALELEGRVAALPGALFQRIGGP